MRYQIKHAIVRYGADTILQDVNFEIHDTEKIAVVGRNGCGKTTLLKLISGEITMDNLDSDEECGIVMAGTQRIAYLKQISVENDEITAEEEIRKVFAPVFTCEKRMQQLTSQMEVESNPQLLKEYDKLQLQMESLQGYTWRPDMETMFQRFGFQLSELKKPMGSFSGGQQTKITFIKLLLSRPDIMLLDEPTNHMDVSTIEWLEGYLKNYGKAVVIVSHDRMFLDRVTDVTYEIEYHRIKRYRGNYTAFLKQKQDALEKQQKDYEAQQKEIKRLTDWIEKWKNTPTKVAATRSKRMVIEHMIKVEKPRRFDIQAFHGQFLPKKVSYTDVLSVKKLLIGYETVLSEVSFELHKGERIAVIGGNGKGKSTLLKTLVEKIPKLGGNFTFGQNVDWVYFDQQAAVSEYGDPNQTVLDNFWDTYPNLKEYDVRNALGSFLFSQEEVYKTLGQLSGGEKVRLALCKLFKQRPNLLILDEPTNHMDMAGKEALETMLAHYSGTVLFVSHDRYFIRTIATGILDFQDNGVTYYSCGYEEYLTEMKAVVPEKVSNQDRDSSQKRVVNENKNPTLSDVFDKKDYYNPGKIMARLKQQRTKYEEKLVTCEKTLNEYRIMQMNPEIASDYEKLLELENLIQKEEKQQESLLERLLEVEIELSDVEN